MKGVLLFIEFVAFKFETAAYLRLFAPNKTPKASQNKQSALAKDPGWPAPGTSVRRSGDHLHAFQ